MKTLSQYITEAIQSDEIINKIKHCHFDFSSCKTKNDADKTTRLEIGKKQEAIAIETLKNALPEYEIMSCEDWCKENSLNWSPKIDSYYGDIMICKDGKTIYNIDLKVGSENYIGSVTALSLSNFGQTTQKQEVLSIFV